MTSHHEVSIDETTELHTWLMQNETKTHECLIYTDEFVNKILFARVIKMSIFK